MRIPLVLLFVQSAVFAVAQDSTKVNRPVQESYPATRYVTIQKEYFGNSNYKVYSKGGDLKDEGRFSGERLKIFALVPVYKKDKLTLSAGAVYTRQSADYYHKTEAAGGYYDKGEMAKNDFDGLFTATYMSMLWKKPLILSGTVILGSTNFFDIKKLSGIVSGVLMLKANATTVSTIGLAVNLDKAAIFPFLPVYTYWHKFSNNLWEIDALLPQKAIVRRSGVLNGWLSGGIEITSNSFFTKQGAEGDYPSGNYEWISTEMNSFVGYEHLVGKNFLLGIKGGYRNSIATRLTKVNENYNNYRSRTNIGSSFFNMNVAYVLGKSRKAGHPKK